jgi:hypothetical protein
MQFTQAFITGKGSYIFHTASAPFAFFAASDFAEQQQKIATPLEKLFSNCNRSPVFKASQVLGRQQFGHSQKIDT